MNKNNRTYKITALFLLTIIMSHLFIFHNELEEKVLCIGDGNHFHIEDIHNSHMSGYQNNFNNKVIDVEYDCVDYLLDNHVDEDYAKQNRNYVARFDKVVKLNLEEYSKPKVSNSFTYDFYLNQKYTKEQFPTVILLI